MAGDGGLAAGGQTVAEDAGGGCMAALIRRFPGAGWGTDAGAGFSARSGSGSGESWTTTGLSSLPPAPAGLVAGSGLGDSVTEGQADGPFLVWDTDWD
jgi:hypothetical protein